MPLRQRDLYVARRARPLVKAHDEPIPIFSFFQGSQHNVVAADFNKRMLRRQAARMGFHLESSQRIIEFVPSSHGQSLLPVSPMRIQTNKLNS